MLQVIEDLAWFLFLASCALVFPAALYGYARWALLIRRAKREREQWESDRATLARMEARK